MAYDKDDFRYIYVVSEQPVLRADVKKKKIPLFSGSFAYLQYGNAVTHVVNYNGTLKSNQALLIYKCVDPRSDEERSILKLVNVNSNKGSNVHIVEVRIVTSSDLQAFKNHTGEPGLIVFKKQFTSFMPVPTFRPPDTIESLKENLKMYLLYRTSEGRYSISHLKSFGIFKLGYSLDDKRNVVEKLLQACNTSISESNFRLNIKLNEKEMKILRNGLLGQASKNLENLISRSLRPQKKRLFGCIPIPF